MQLRQTFIILFTLLGVFASPLAGAQDVLPDRPSASGNRQAKAETEKAKDDLSEAWERDRNPQILLMLGLESNGKVNYDHTSQMSNRVASPLKRHLRDVFEDGVVVPSIKRLKESKAMDRLGRDVGKALTPEGKDVLKKLFDADIVMDITLLRSNTDPGRFAVNMEVFDMREGVEIASDSLRTVSPNVTEAQGVAMADAIIRSFAREYAKPRRVGRKISKTYEFKVLGITGNGGVGQEVLRQITSGLEDNGGDVKWAESEFADMQDVGFAQMRVRFAGRQDALLTLIEKRILSSLDLAWRVQNADGTIATVFLFKNQVPDWYRLTDVNDPTFQDTARNRNAKLAASGLPKLGIIVGEDFNEPLGQFVAQGQALDASVDTQSLEGTLQDQFTQLGFRVVDNSTLRAQLKKQLGNAKRYENLPHLQRAMGDLEAVDMVLHLNIKPGTNGKRFNARLFDVSQGQVVGFQSWPNDAANRLNQFKVNVENPEEVARYLTGQMLVRYDRFAERSLNTMDVQIRNVADSQDTLALTEILKGNLSQVTAVTDVQAITPLSTFELVYTGQPDDLVLPALNAIGKRFPGAEVQVLGNALIINLKPVVKSDEQLAAEEELFRQELQSVLGPQEPEPAKEAPPVQLQGESADIGNKLLAARDSVFLVGLNVNGQFTGMGTAWQVGPGMLATNAHVVIDLHQKRVKLVHDGINPQAIEFAGLRGHTHDGLVIFSLDVTVHQKYLHHQKQWNEYLNDITQREGVERAQTLAAYVPVAGGDVALLNIAQGNDAPQLPIAAREGLESQLNPTDVIAYIGFPSENLVKMSAPGKLGNPTQQIDIGHIMAITDFEASTGTPNTRQLIHYDLITAGGASGSPVFNTKGEVIAVNSAGSYIFVSKEVSSSPRIRTGVAYGQRADLVLDLLNGKGVRLGAKDFQ